MATDIDSFPWHLGVFDAHCHPTDVMSSVPSIPAMKARALTIMATRAQDQQLVDQTAREYGVKSSAMETNNRERIIPSFGWHPWFSHQLYDDASNGGQKTMNESEKVAHYQSVLAPKKSKLSEYDESLFKALPDPTSISNFIDQTRHYLQQHPFALVGEVGLDRSFRIPESWDSENADRRDNSLTPGGREGRRLSPYRVDLEHQKAVLLAQLKLAAEMVRPVSLHGVQTHGALFDLLKQTWRGHEKKGSSRRERKKQDLYVDERPVNFETGNQEPRPYPPRICLHSYSGNRSAFRQWLDPYIPLEVFVSFSFCINVADQNEDALENFKDVVRAVPDDRVLVESDRHTAGDTMDTDLENITRMVCDVKGWSLEDGVLRLGNNWKRFIFGNN
jgi:Tat protein secretion system quality control protein TatD with DNase activity